MQFLKISSTTTLAQLTDMVGEANVSNILALNGLEREKYIGKQFQEKCKEIMHDPEPVSWERQVSILNSFTDDGEVYETAALQGQSGWKVLSALGTFKDALRIPDDIQLPNSTDIIGGTEPLTKDVYEKSMASLMNPPHYIDSEIFDTFDLTKSVQLVSTHISYSKVFELFNIPWGDISFYDSISGKSIDLPVYPENLTDTRNASYATMQDILYQYEPWQIYTSSGPRTSTYSFHFHRQMWTGNELDGKANELIRFCQACLYPEFRGSAVNTSTVRLYVKGYTLISGILQDVNVTWDGPIGRDGWYLECTLDLMITEVAEQALTHDVVKGLPLIG